MSFVREHWRPLTGAAVLHIVLFALVIFAAWNWPRSEPPEQLAIEGVVVDAKDVPAPRARPEPVPPPETVPEPEPVMSATGGAGGDVRGRRSCWCVPQG